MVLWEVNEALVHLKTPLTQSGLLFPLPLLWTDSMNDMINTMEVILGQCSNPEAGCMQLSDTWKTYIWSLEQHVRNMTMLL